MEKDILSQINEKLSDVPRGSYLYIRHPLGTSGELNQFCDADYPSDVRLKTETYELYPGIELSYQRFLGSQFHFCHRHGVSVLSVDHCKSGRIGWKMHGGLSLYFGSGDLAFHFTDKCLDSEISLPLGYYEGLSVSLDTEILKTNRPELLAEAGADAEALCRKFCGSKETAALPASPHIEHIFSEVYDLPEQLKIPFLKLKCQELLIFLTITEPPCGRTLDLHYSEQVEIIRQIHDLITEHPERRYTIEELSRQYLINTAALKSIFKSVYGMPIASYMKQFRIAHAAKLLRESDDSIADIARAVGYESQSKFSAAFKETMKILPTDYRRQYK